MCESIRMWRILEIIQKGGKKPNNFHAAKSCQIYQEIPLISFCIETVTVSDIFCIT